MKRFSSAKDGRPIMRRPNPLWYEPVGNTLTVFHGTWSENLPSICRDGLVGYRDRNWAIRIINRVLELFNLKRRDVPTWVYEYEIFDRSQRFHRLHFTTNYSYAWIHCWAGFELEHQIIINVLRWMQEDVKIDRKSIERFIAASHIGQPIVTWWELPFDLAVNWDDLRSTILRIQQRDRSDYDEDPRGQSPDIVVTVNIRVPPICLKRVDWINTEKYLSLRTGRLSLADIKASIERSEEVRCLSGKIPETTIPVGPRSSWKQRFVLPV